jgi:hypothetical protein
MKLKISTIAALIGLMLFASACAGIGGGIGSNSGMPVELPGIESGLTEAGNPTEEETEIKGVYINTEFDVRVDYPPTWDVEKRGSEEAQFSSNEDESITAQFVWLEDGESFEDFIIGARGSFEKMITKIESAFDATVCAVDDMGQPEDGMIIVECYYYNKTPAGDSVIVASGFIGSETGSSAVVFSPVGGFDGKGQSTGDSDPITAEFKPQDDGSDSRKHKPSDKSRKPTEAKLIFGDGAPRKPAMTHESPFSGWDGIGNVPRRRN